MKPFGASIRALVVLLVTGAFAGANPSTGSIRSRTTGPWEQPSTWEVCEGLDAWRTLTVHDALPGEADRVVIRSGHVVFVSTEQHVGKLYVERGTQLDGPGTLEIHSAGKLWIHRNLTVARERDGAAAGRIVFTGSAGPAGVLHAAGSVQIYGDVEILGAAGGVISSEKPVYRVSFGPDARLTAPAGPLTISCPVEMDGTVIADGPHAVTVSGDRIKEGSSGTWKVAHRDAAIIFDTAKDVFLRAGEIVVEKGVFEAACNVKVARPMTHAEEARITVRPGATLEVAGQLAELDEHRNVIHRSSRRARHGGDLSGK